MPPQDDNGGYPLSETEPFGPDQPEWIYGDQDGETFYSAFLSNAQRLPNGNTLLNSGSQGTVFEVDPQRNVVWRYIIPLNADSPIPQGLAGSNNWSFRAYKFDASYPGLEGKDLTPGGTIEIGDSPLDCMILVGNEEIEKDENPIEITYSNASRTITFLNPTQEAFTCSLINMAGQLQLSRTVSTGTNSIFLPQLISGIYLLHLQSKRGVEYIEKVSVF